MISNNKYLKRLVRTYSNVMVNERKIAEMAEEAANLKPEDVGIDITDLEKSADVILKSLKKLGINVSKMSDEDLVFYILNLYNKIGGVPDVLSDKVSVILANKLKAANHDIEAYRYSYGKHNKLFSSNSIYRKVMQALAMAGIFFEISPFTKLNAANVTSYIANNPKVVESVIEASLLAGKTSKEGDVIVYAPDRHVQQLPPYAGPCVNQIKSVVKSKVGDALYDIYSRFEEAGALTPLPQNDSLDVTTRLALRIFWGARIMYREFINKGPQSFDKILGSDERTEIATQYIVFATMAYNILSKLDYATLGVEPAQRTKLIQDLMAGKYDVKFKNNKNEIVHKFSRNLIIQMHDSDIEFEIRLHEIEVLGLGQVNSEIRDKLMKDKVAITQVEKSPLYDFYIVLPVLVTKDSMGSVHEVAFKIRCDLVIYGVQTAGTSQANANATSAPLRRRKIRLFRRKRKYDWM